MVFQSYSLFPNMSVADNIALLLKSGMGAKSGPRASPKRWALTNITGLENRRINQLSVGPRPARVALARAVAIRPFILLLASP